MILAPESSKGVPRRPSKQSLAISIRRQMLSSTAHSRCKDPWTNTADRILREMSEYLKKASEFTFHAEVAYDSVLASGQKIQFGGASKVTVHRPNRLHVEYRGDQRRTRVVFDGRIFTIHDMVADVYTLTEVPPEIDAAVDRMFEQYGFSVPIADFVYADPY